MSELMIDIRKLSIFNKMAKEGGNTVANHMSQMTGMNTEMEITKINFIDIPDIKTHVGDDEQIGIYIQMQEPPHGHVLFLFNADSAKRLAADEIIGDRDSDMALMFDSRVHAQNEDINVKVYTFPKLEELVGLMQRLEV